jgi:predicted helicase
LQPQTEFYLFSPQNTDLLPEYEQGRRIIDIMPVNSAGVKTHRDHFVFDFEISYLHQRIKNFRDLNISDSQIQSEYLLQETSDWQLYQQRRILSSCVNWKEFFVKCLYRPFDFREYYHHSSVVNRPRQEIMQHFMNVHSNIGLLISRQVVKDFRHIFCTDTIANINALDTAGKFGGGPIIPLYLYPTNTPTLFDSTPTNAPGERKPNLSPEFITQFSQKLDLEFISDGKGDKTKTFGPEDIFNYIYAIFHAPIYRQRYAEFLKIDFPRVPLTANAALFWELVIKGDKLVKYHLMKETGTEISTYPIPGSDIVEQVKYHENHQQIWINAEQYFDQVPQQIWNFYIGGYQVCQKWLKDRKGRQLNFDDINHYQNIISIISETIKIMENIDQIIENYGGFPLE